MKPIKIVITADHLTIKGLDYLKHDCTDSEILDFTNRLVEVFRLLDLNVQFVPKKDVHCMLYGEPEELFKFLYEITRDYDVDLI